MKPALTVFAPVLRLFWREQRLMLTAGAAASLATALAGMALLGLSGWFITATAIAGLSLATALAFDVFAPSAGIRFLALARTGARYAERLATHEATLATLAALRERLFRGWAAPDAARMLMHRPARLLFRLTADTDALDTLYLRLLIPAVTALGAILAAALALGLIAPWLGIGAGAGVLVLQVLLLVRAARAAGAPVRRRTHALEALRARTTDLVAGQTELAMAGRLGAQRGAIAAADARIAAEDDRLNRIETGLAIATGIVSALLLAGVLLAVAVLAQGPDAISAPVAALALLIAFSLGDPMMPLRRGAMEFPRLLLAARRLAPRLSVEPAPHGPARPEPGLAVVLDAATGRYPGAARPALPAVDLKVAEGEHVAIVGPSGSGKSTLLALISGELAPGAGHVAALPATLLTQRTELFRDTLAENLRLADPEASDARLVEVLEAAGLGTFAGALDSTLGEGGTGLSGGQARRLGLARLMLRDTPLWLLDEPTEGLDGVTARDVMTRLRARAAGRSLVIATHCRREAEGCDRLILLDRGRILSAPVRGSAAHEAALAALRPD